MKAKRVSSAAERFNIVWIDKEREPECAPNPAYPDGIHIDASEGALKTCTATVPYPADRCGIYAITCRTCGVHVALTTAGRADDPRSIKFACKQKPN